MEICFTQDASHEVAGKLNFIAGYDSAFKDFFSAKRYGDDIDILCIGLFCMSPKFEAFFTKKRRPMYYVEPKTYIHRGIQVSRPGKWFQYELRLNFEHYIQEEYLKTLLSKDILNSLPVIRSVKKVRDFDLDSFTNDLETFFEMYWK